jgi:hypothetical protein
LVSYEWEQRYFHGSLIAVHKNNQFFAYAIKMDTTGKVRVFHRKSNEKILLKSFKGRIVDLAFAYIDSEVLLACLDESGSLQIFNITIDLDSKIQ